MVLNKDINLRNNCFNLDCPNFFENVGGALKIHLQYFSQREYCFAKENDFSNQIN
jgi:hypothetical protein